LGILRERLLVELEGLGVIARLERRAGPGQKPRLPGRFYRLGRVVAAVVLIGCE